jgi:hypothetical protein
MVNIYNRRLHFSEFARAELSGPLMSAPLNRIAMLTDYVAPEERAVACPNQDVVYGIVALALDLLPSWCRSSARTQPPRENTPISCLVSLASPETLEWLDRCWVPSHAMRKRIPHHFLRAVVAFAFCNVQSHVRAESPVPAVEAGVAPISGMEIEPQNVPTASRKAPVGLLPIPDYSANIWTREHLTGDWWGARIYLANKGVQIGVELNQYVQGVTNGGRDRTAAYGGTADYTVNLDLMRMGILPGALIKFRAESRFGSSVNGQAGPILPVNTDALFPLTDTLDEAHHGHRPQLYSVPFALSGRFLR